MVYAKGTGPVVSECGPFAGAWPQRVASADLEGSNEPSPPTTAAGNRTLRSAPTMEATTSTAGAPTETTKSHARGTSARPGCTKKWIGGLLLNCRSVCNKAFAIKDYVVEHDFDIVLLCETWLTSSKQRICGDLTPAGYTLRVLNRNGKRGGGIAVLYKKMLKMKDVKDISTTSMEALSFNLDTPETVRIILLYRLIPASHAISQGDFFRDLRDVLEPSLMKPSPLLLAGDFNVHWDNPREAGSILMKDLCTSCELKQHVLGPTHHDGHTLDLLLTRDNDSLLTDVMLGSQLSDNSAVHFSMNINKPHPERKRTSFRKLRDVNHNALEADMRECIEALSEERYDRAISDVQELTDHYDSCLRELLNKHAPEKEVILTVKARAPWYNTDIAEAKKRKRQAEKTWKSTKLTVNWDAYKQCRNELNCLIVETRKDFYKEKVVACEGDQRSLFKVVDKLLHRNQTEIGNITADSFSKFFEDKIEKIWENLQKSDPESTSRQPRRDEAMSSRPPPELSILRPANEAEMRKNIMSLSNATCSLDPMPTPFIKKHIDTILPLITAIVNASLRSGQVPQSMKEAVVRPRLKKPDLDVNDPKNYRPISNLSFISKLVEKTVTRRIVEHMTENELHEDFQSAYKTAHSTETALLRVKTDLLRALERKEGVIMVLLDLSAAFDTVSHPGLLRILETRVGLRGTALDWFSAYLADRKQAVRLNEKTAPRTTLTRGVPQGSVLGPLLFTIYTLALGDIVRRHDMDAHFYADDTQLYASFSSSNSSDVIVKMEECVAEIRSWMATHCLQLNDAKTEVICYASSRSPLRDTEYSVMVGDARIQTSRTVRNLGVMFDDALDMKSFVSKTCSLCYQHLRDISSIRRSLTEDAAIKLVHALITSRVDYCNSLLLGAPACVIRKLQRVLNTAARVVTQSSRAREPSTTALLKRLHWLPIKSRIDYKALLLVYKCLNDGAPSYLTSMLDVYLPARPLRSVAENRLVVSRTCNTYGDQTFPVSAAHLWNALPDDVRSANSLEAFKSRLKTHLFVQAFR